MNPKSSDFEANNAYVTQLSKNSETTERQLGVDVARGTAALLVVYLHSCIPYVHPNMPGLTWLTYDNSSKLTTLSFWLVELFIMPLFLIIAGFYARKSLTKQGPHAFIIARHKRLLKPFLWGCLLILPLEYYLWVVSWVIEGKIPVESLWKLKVPRDHRHHLFGTAHLWFLPYTLSYCLVLATLHYLLGTGPPNVTKRLKDWAKIRIHEEFLRKKNRGLNNPYLLPMYISNTLAVVFFLATAPEVVFGFQHAFIPVLSKWCYSGTYFAAGAITASGGYQLSIITPRPLKALSCGSVASMIAIAVGTWSIAFADPLSANLQTNWQTSLILSILTTIAAWKISTSLVEILSCLPTIFSLYRFLRPAVTYLASASFYVYLLHHPLVALIQLNLKINAPNHSPALKVLICFSLAVSLTIGIYYLGSKIRKPHSRCSIDVSRREYNRSQLTDKQLTT